MLWLISNNRDEFNGLVDELTALGFKYSFFSKISDALNQLKKETPEGILIDADESEILCFEFCHQIKSLSHQSIKNLFQCILIRYLFHYHLKNLNYCI